MKRFISFFVFVVFTFSVFAISYSEYVIVNDLDSALKVANIVQKEVLVVFSLPNCPNCNKLKNEAFSDVQISEYVKKNFIPVFLDAEKTRFVNFPFDYLFDSKASFQKIDYYDLAVNKFSLREVPHTLLLDKKFQLIGGFPKYFDKSSFFSSLKNLAKKENTATKHVKSISALEADFLLKNLPNAKSYYWSTWKTDYKFAGKYDYAIIRNSNLKDVLDFINSNSNTPFNVLVVEK